MTVLLIEDNDVIVKANARALELAGYASFAAPTLAKAREYLSSNKPDIIILDIMMPDGSGLEFCREIRQTLTLPILFLTCLNEKKDIIDGLRSGGDDYLSKPYDIDEMIARIEALFRRVSMNTQSDKEHVVLHNISIDTIIRRAFVNGENAFLSPKEYDLLIILYQSINNFITAAALYTRVWGQEPVGSTQTLTVRIHNLKKKLSLNENDHVRIEYVKNRGYRLFVE